MPKVRTDSYAATKPGQRSKAGRIGYAEKQLAARAYLAQQAKRPRVYSTDIARAVCHRIANGETLLAVVRDENMPDFETIHAWRRTHAEFAAQFERAREIQSHAFVDQALSIADDASNDVLYRPNGDPIPNNAAVQRSRLRANQRSWMAGKLNPAAYADKQIHTGPDGTGPIEVQVRADYERLSVEELEQLRDLLERASGVQIEGQAEPIVEPQSEEGEKAAE